MAFSWPSVKQIGVRCPPPMSNQLGGLRRDSKQFVDKRRRKKRPKNREERKERKEGRKRRRKSYKTSNVARLKDQGLDPTHYKR